MKSLILSPDPVLQTPTEQFSFENPQENLGELLSEMTRIMENEGGIGIAAPQVGSPLSIFLLRKKSGKILTFINPTVEILNPIQVSLQEGCLSFPQFKNGIQVNRYKKVLVQAFNETGDPFTYESETLLESRCIQHENDHLLGKTLLDYLRTYGPSGI